MNQKMMAGAFCALIAMRAYAQESIYTDEVVVTANRIPQARQDVLADVSVIEREEIARSGQSTLVELLRTQPGVEMDSSGGVGSLANVRLRGTNSNQIVVLVDGMRVGSATSGLTAFNQIMPEQVERIEILRGPASSLYGADAVGGVIQIFTRKGDGTPQVSAYAGYGSYATRQGGGSVSGSLGDTRYALNVGLYKTRGISALDVDAGYDADHDGYRNTTLSGQLTHTFTEGHDAGFQVYNSDGHGEFDGNNFPNRNTMRQYSYALTSNNRFLPFWNSHIRLGKSLDQYDSKSFYGDSSVKTFQNQYSWLHELNLPLGTLTLGWDRLEQHVDSTTDYAKTRRTDDGLLANYLLDRGPHALQMGLRTDKDSQFGRHNTGNIGYGYRFADFWRIAGNYGTAFRAPTFNDLYWPYQDYGAYGSYQGNPNLRPETSRNKELSVTYDQGHHRVSATAFHNKIDDLIICCLGLFHDSPANVGSATIKGMTLTYEGWFSRYHLRASADVQSPKDDETGNVLPRRSRRYGSLTAGGAWGALELGAELTASGERYNDAANQVKLAGYGLVNLIANYKLNPEWSINARLNNVFDRNYALATTKTPPSIYDPNSMLNPDYNTPGANLFVGVRWQPK